MFIMELQFEEIDKRRVSFGYLDDDSNEIQDVDFSKTNLKKPSPNVGSFQTINRTKPSPQFSTNRTNIPIDATVFSQKSAPVQPIKKKNISYDDMLSSMGMVLGADGKLQIFNKNAVQHQQNQNIVQRQQQNRNVLQQQNRNTVQQQRNYPVQQQQQQQQEEQSPPLTRRQYKQLVVLDLIRKQQEQIRLSHVKSTKLLFPNSNVHISTAPTGRPNINRLFKFVGK
jgi:hypothetical protein